MGLKRVRAAKNAPSFVWGDLLGYALIAALFLLSLATFFQGHKSLEGVRIYVADELAYTYYFDGGGGAERGWESAFELSENGACLTIFTKSGGYNRLKIDCAEKSVCMGGANCSKNRDCVYMKKITSANGVIVCVPHGVKVVAIGYSEDVSEPSLGKSFGN